MTGQKSNFKFKDYELEAAFKMAIKWAKMDDLPGEEVINPTEETDDVPF